MVNREKIWQDKYLIETIKNGGVVIAPTDTIYGILGQALARETVERIYKIKKRAPEKPCIILISEVKDLEKFGVSLTEPARQETKKYWPGPVSIVFDCEDSRFYYLHRGTKSLAFRLASHQGLRSLIKETGPLIAPSANPEGLPPARNTEEAKKYFGDQVDYYADAGQIEGKASKLIRIASDGMATVLRE